MAALPKWTDERTDTYGVMNAVAGRKDLGRLFRLWETVVGEGDSPT